VPGTLSRQQLISEVDQGLYIENCKGYDVGENRASFSLLGERGWKIQDGRIVGLVRYPIVYGETPTLWMSCSGVAGPEEDWVVGLSGCGKGQPWQSVWTGQGGPPARFERVKVGSVI
jgi:TldD protein